MNVILATLLAALAGLVAYASFRVVRDEETGSTSSIGPLSKGTFAYRLTPRGTAKADKCYGSFRVSFDPDLNDKQVTFEGSMRLSYQGVKATPLIHGEMTFNPIGQLGGSLVSIKVEDTEVQLGTRNINPITLSIRSLGNAAKYNFQFIIPGPIELRRQSKTVYVLASTIFKPLNSSVSTLGVTPIVNHLPQLTEVADDDAACNEDDEIPLRLETVITAMGSSPRAFQNPLSALLPGRSSP